MCELDVVLVYEVYTEQKAQMLYPINLLRNLARIQVCVLCVLCVQRPIIADYRMV